MRVVANANIEHPQNKPFWGSKGDQLRGWCKVPFHCVVRTWRRARPSRRTACRSGTRSSSCRTWCRWPCDRTPGGRSRSPSPCRFCRDCPLGPSADPSRRLMTRQAGDWTCRETFNTAQKKKKLYIMHRGGPKGRQRALLLNKKHLILSSQPNLEVRSCSQPPPKCHCLLWLCVKVFLWWPHGHYQLKRAGTRVNIYTADILQLSVWCASHVEAREEIHLMLGQCSWSMTQLKYSNVCCGKLRHYFTSRNPSAKCHSTGRTTYQDVTRRIVA